MSSDSDYQSEVFRLALAAGFYHPEPKSRAKVRQALDEWLGTLGELPQESVVRDLIAGEKGTILEPFVLTPEDFECAVFLARSAFSAAGGQTRLRIVSRETIGRGGGLVITNRLRSYYAERYALGKNRRQTRTGWIFIPAEIPTKGQVGPDMIKATLTSEENGLRISLPVPECRTETATFARQLQKHSRIKDVNGSFSELGLRVECKKGEVHVLTGSPESMIRIMAHMISGTSLLLKGGSSDIHIPLILVQLGAPDDVPVRLPTLIGSTLAYASWMSGDIPSLLPLSRQQELAISSWLRPHPDWSESILSAQS